MKKNLLNFILAISFFALTVNIGMALSPSECGYEISANAVKYCDQVVSGADAASFKADIDPYYNVHAVDKNYAYFLARIIEGADPATFQIPNWRQNLSRDANHVFCEDKLLTTDVKNFKLLQEGDNLSADGSAVYYGCDKLENSDPKTFTSLYSTEGYDYFFKDKNNVYYQKYRLTADAASFQDLGNGYGKDVNAVYFKNFGKVANADLKSFYADYWYNNAQITAECNNVSYDAYDDTYCYQKGTSVISRNKSAVITPKREKPYFSDIQKDSLDYFYEHGIFVGYADGTFGFNKNLTRAELIKIVMMAGLIPNTATNLNCFSDVKNSDWFAPYVCTAKDKGFIQGYSDGNYQPNNSVNKVEALKMIAEVLVWPGLDTAPQGAAFKDTYKNEWYYQYVIYALNSFFIEMSADHNFYPGNPIIRGDAAEILFRTLVSQAENGSLGFTSKDDYEAKRTLFFQHYESLK